VRHRLEHFLPRVVDLRERDERAPQIVTAARAQTEELEIAVERELRLQALPHREVARRHDEIVPGRRAPEDARTDSDENPSKIPTS
jgi:hypothetical protein